MEASAKKEYQKEIFINRLIKQQSKLKKWIKKENIYCYRLYDKDIPEIPLVVDLYNSLEKVPYLCVSLYRRPYKTDEKEEMKEITEFAFCAGDVLGVEKDHIFIKIREKQKGSSQYQKKLDDKNGVFITKEGNALFNINLSEYIDSGLFLDHRPLRLEISKVSKGKDVLNLFCYTASFSIHAILGGAKSSLGVDTSKSALKRAKENMRLNNINLSQMFCFENMEVMQFLDNAIKMGRVWDIIICDPPTFSNSSSWKGVFDVNKDYFELCTKCIKLLRNNGSLYFSSNSRRLKFDSSLLKNTVQNNIFIKDISLSSIPKDFRNKKIHKAWKIIKEN